MSKYKLYIEDVSVEAVFNKLGGVEGARRYLREPQVSKPTRAWLEVGEVIMFSVTSDGITGPEWILRLERKGFRLSAEAKLVLTSIDFKATTGIVFEVAILKNGFSAEGHQSDGVVCAEASRRKLLRPNVELACLIREYLTDKQIHEMGLCHIITMHEPTQTTPSATGQLRVNADGDNRWLDMEYSKSFSSGYYGVGFAFVSRKIVPKTKLF